jgi:hypothetical protein
VNVAEGSKARHGGKREGSGRKQLLDLGERLAVILDYRATMGKRARAEAMARFEATRRANYPDLVRMQDTARAVPVARRRKFLASKDGQHLADVGAEILDILDAYGTRQFATVPPKRPQGVRGGILADVARRASERTGAIITPAYVEKCLKDPEARAIADELNRCDIEET